MAFKRIYIEITNVCNMSCSFCPKCKREKRFMTAEEFESILCQFEKPLPQLYFHVKGEPLMHPDLAEFLKLADKYGFLVNITTNGTFLEKQAETLLSSPCLRQVNLSVHSLEEKSAEENTAYLKTLAKFGKTCSLRKSPYVVYRMWNGAGEGEPISDVALAQLNAISEEYGIHLDLFLPHGRNAAHLAENVFVSFMDRFVWPSLNHEVVGTRGKCHGGRDMLAILCDGTVVPCCLDENGDAPMGNIFTQSLDEIVSSERFKNMQKGFYGGNITEALCQRCEYRLRFKKKPE
ncbi:MAG: SPASM domain-containing protein [Oscillospiraceae bacterium]